jgi:hypothetical protein
MSRESALLVGSALLLFVAGPHLRAAAADDEESLAAHESDETSRLIRAELPSGGATQKSPKRLQAMIASCPAAALTPPCRSPRLPYSTSSSGWVGRMA